VAKRRPAVVHGVLAIDKPIGPTSRHVVNSAMRLLGERRCGHAGTLDPDASGVLIVCFGDATPASRWLMAAPKRYVAEVRFGFETTTDDAEGTPTHVAAALDLDDTAVVDALRLAGDDVQARYVAQRPPDVSALKREGVRDYERVRRGEIIERQARSVWQGSIELLDASGDVARFRLDVGSGYYVRAWARDLGRRVGSAAHLVGLRRTFCGGVAADAATTLEALAALELQARIDALLPVAAALGRVLPTLRLSDEALLLALSQGKRPRVDAELLTAATTPPTPAIAADEDAEADRAFLVCDGADAPIAVVSVHPTPDDEDVSGSTPDMRQSDGEGLSLRVVRGFVHELGAAPPAEET
jgi:tRNA pseudouridine55 synthase